MNETQPKIKVIGNPLSPYVRKVLACLEYKSLNWEIDPILAPLANQAFSENNPQRYIPVLEVQDADGLFKVADSSVICQYLDERFPNPGIYPENPELAARARYLEEYADTKLFDVMVLKLFVHRVLRPNFGTGEPDEALVTESLQNGFPEALEYLESVTPQQGWLVGEFSVADCAIGAFSRLVILSGLKFDAGRWPRFSGYFQRVMAAPMFASRFSLEEALLDTPLDQHSNKLRQLGYVVHDDFRG